MADSKTTQAKSAIDLALELLMPAAGEGQSAGNSPIQAANSRTVLDTLVATDPDELLSGELNLRVMTQSLFDWHGTKRSTKTLLHAFHNALRVPGRYDQAVELTAFLSALSPLLEADRLARLYSLTTQVESVYAPVRYTVSLANKLESVLGKYSQQRIEQLAGTLWLDAHSGRWWDMTDGVADEDAPAPAAPPQDVVERLIETGRAHWSPEAAARLAALPYDERIHDVIRSYVKRANRGDDVAPDLSVLAAAISWLPILDRPESPIGPLIHTLRTIQDALGEHYTEPPKPKRFRDLFPDVRIYGERIAFPFHPDVLAVDSITRKGVRFELVKSPAALQENRTYMGNCTWSMKGRMEKGTYALYRLHFKGSIYNAAMSVSGNSWRVGEINSRGNRGNVPEIVRQAFAAMVRSLPAQSAVDSQRYSEAAALRIKARFAVI